MFRRKPVSQQVVQVVMVVPNKPPPALGWRVLYGLTIGWWFGTIWLVIAIALFTTIIGIPIGLLMLKGALKAYIL